ncbi:hypothetical protein BC833DRAFT_653621 [Globomyces pollinis-pini]|nr:hypothetical protein BC833DRAFT_653621 [Globomyces pollinis-pini]
MIPTALNDTDPVVIQKIWDTINSGWLVVKLLEVIIIPYFYFMMRPNKIVYCLFLASLLNIPHNIFGFLAVYITVIYPNIPPTGFWLVQASCAALIRCIEFYVNYQIIVGLCEEKMGNVLFILNWVCGAIVIFGRVGDAIKDNFIAASGVRWGMAIVSMSGVLNSTFGIICLRRGVLNVISKDSRSKTKIGAILSNCVFRMFFIQFIDFGLIIGFLWAKRSYYTNWWFWIFDNLDNSRALLLLMDVICVKMFTEKTDTSDMSMIKSVAVTK